MTNELWNSLANCPYCDLKNCIDPHTHLLDEDILTAGRLALRLLRLSGDGLALGIELLGHLFFLRHNRCTILFVFSIVDEHVVLF